MYYDAVTTGITRIVLDSLVLELLFWYATLDNTNRKQL